MQEENGSANDLPAEPAQPQGYAALGERVTGILEAAEQAAGEIRDDARKLADELHGRHGLDRLSRQARSLSRRVLVPDENVGWNLTAIPAAVRIVRAEGIDVVITTSPPNSVHLVGAAVKRITGARWVADLLYEVSARDAAIYGGVSIGDKKPTDIVGRAVVVRSGKVFAS